VPQPAASSSALRGLGGFGRFGWLDTLASLVIYQFTFDFTLASQRFFHSDEFHPKMRRDHGSRKLKKVSTMVKK
jgi:hypothetical protein